MMGADEGPHGWRRRDWRGRAGCRAGLPSWWLPARARRSRPALHAGRPCRRAVRSSSFPARVLSYRDRRSHARSGAVCNRALGRAACLDKLHLLTCGAGGDTAYGFKEGINPDGAGMFISATVAVRNDVSPAIHSATAGALHAATRRRLLRSAARQSARPGLPARSGNASRSATPPASRPRSAIATAPVSPRRRSSPGRSNRAALACAGAPDRRVRVR